MQWRVWKALSSVCFIQALKGLSHPTTSRRGNVFGMVGMLIAIVTTVALILKLQGAAGTQSNGAGIALVIFGLLVGGSAGTVMARRVEMTKMPELVAFMHSMIGLAAVFIAIACVAEPWAFNIVGHGEPIPVGNRIELFIGTFVGAITFSGSVIAFGKLSGKYKFRLFQGAPVTFAGQHALNLILAIAMVLCGIWFTATQGWTPFWLMTAILRAGCADHHPDRRCRHAGGGLDAQQLLGLGGSRHRLLAEQPDADHRRFAGGLQRRHPLVHHVQGDEPLVLQRDPGRLS